MLDEIENRLRLARLELPQPNPESEEKALTAALAELPEPAPRNRAGRRGFLNVLRDAFRARRRQLAVLVAAVVPSIALGIAVGVLLWPGPSGAVASSAYPGPTFTPAKGWTTVTSSPREIKAGWGPLAWATNVPLPPDTGPFGIRGARGAKLTDLPVDGIAIVAWLGGPHTGSGPDPRDSFRHLDLPLTLSDAELRRGWEGQPAPNIPEYVIWARINEQFVDVRVYFGTQQPSADSLAEANEELARLQIPDPS